MDGVGVGRLLLTAGLGLAMAMGVACGGGGGSPAVTEVAASDVTTTTADPAAAFAACLREHGVDPSDRPRPTDGTGTPPSSRPQGAGGPGSSRPPGSRPSTSLPAGADQAALAAARQACQSLQPTDRGPANGPPSQAFQVYASCLKDHGVTITPGAPERTDPAFQAADAICGVLRPSPPAA
jgi:hypothetical protein